jgi:hypothetical protein
LLQQAGSGSLDVRLKKFAEERNELLDEVRHLKLELEEERSKRMSDSRSGHGSLSNGPLDEETSKLMSDYKFKLQKAEQDVSTLQANVSANFFKIFYLLLIHGSEKIKINVSFQSFFSCQTNVFRIFLADQV